MSTERSMYVQFTSFTEQEMKFSTEQKFSIQFPADMLTFTEEILNGKLHFLCSVLPGDNAEVFGNFKNFKQKDWFCHENGFIIIFSILECYLALSAETHSSWF